MCFKLRRLGVYKGMNVKNQGSDEKCFNMRQGVRGVHQYFLGSEGNASIFNGCTRICEGGDGNASMLLTENIRQGNENLVHPVN